MRLNLLDALSQLPGERGERFAVAFERGTVSVEVYAPRGTDPQGPHTRDELYVVVQGRGTFVCGDRRDRFGPGDLLFAAAGVSHRFADFTDDLVVWVVFYGPEGGERPGVRRVLGHEERE
ncbi:MAG: cupin domain-containing protein [Myxococcaceae bacterium]|nr:cupin domain-containing protein [Myxococcaceae bacterium]MCI0670227.1 cupin domain-containing protein [Myxococcaceae bacterium]